MSSPRNVVGGGQPREGTRVVLREITAMLHNSPTQASPRRESGNDNSTFSKAPTSEHEVKVRFAREFADADSVTYSAPESLSSASSFYSISSTLSTKSSSGINPDSVPNSPQIFEAANSSYVDNNIPGVDDLIRACAHIQITSGTENFESPSFIYESPNNTQDQTFESAHSETPLNITNVILETSQTESTLEEKQPTDNVLPPLDVTQSLSNCHSQSPPEDRQEYLTCTDLQQDPACLEVFSSPAKENIIDDKHVLERNRWNSRESEIESVKLFLEESLTKSTSLTDLKESEATKVEEVSSGTDENKTGIDDTDTGKSVVDNVDEKSTDANTSGNKLLSEVLDESKDYSNTGEKKVDIDNIEENIKDIVNIDEKKIETDNVIKEETAADNVINEETAAGNIIIEEIAADNIIKDETVANNITKEETIAHNTNEKETNVHSIEKDKSVTHQELSPLSNPPNENNNCNKEEVTSESETAFEQQSVQLECKNNLPEPVFIETEKVQERSNITDDLKDQASTEELDKTLTLPSDINLDSLNELEQYEEFKPQRQSTSLCNVNAICEFKDLEFAAGEIADDILKSSLEFEDDIYTTPVVEIFQDPTTFDFLSARGNSHTTTRLRNESLYVKFDPLLAEVSMLSPGNDSVFSTLPSGTIHKLDEIQEKNDEPIQVSNKSDTKEVDDADVTEKLELVRATVLQLEKELEKQKKEYEAELERQKNAFQEKITKLQAQLSQEIENKNQLTVVVDEYEKSISRLLTEKERDRANMEQEKMKLQEELQATNHHLSNTEAAFNDVHLKYERLKGVVSAYKNNESVLKESIQENLETIKSLDNRYDQLKTHAMSQLRKANLELVDIRKQHEAETVKLHAMVKKAELKSNSLAEIVEQKTKENKELTQILDELIARVGRQNAE